MTQVYLFTYNPMTEESVAETISVHVTPEGAKKAMLLHREAKRIEWDKMYDIDDEEPPYKFGRFEEWNIKIMTLEA